MPRARKTADDTAVLAFGSADGWNISVDEFVQGSEQWMIEVDGPQFYVAFLPKNLTVVDETVAFLEEGLAELTVKPISDPLGEMLLGKWGSGGFSDLGQRSLGSLRLTYWSSLQLHDAIRVA